MRDELASNGLRLGGRPVRACVTATEDGCLFDVSDSLTEGPPEPGYGTGTRPGRTRPLPHREADRSARLARHRRSRARLGCQHGPAAVTAALASWPLWVPGVFTAQRLPRQVPGPPGAAPDRGHFRGCGPTPLFGDPGRYLPSLPGARDPTPGRCRAKRRRLVLWVACAACSPNGA